MTANHTVTGLWGRLGEARAPRHLQPQDLPWISPALISTTVLPALGSVVRLGFNLTVQAALQLGENLHQRSREHFFPKPPSL